MSKIIDNYTLQNSIGQGQYGKVYKAFHNQTNLVVAIKVIKLERFKQVPKLNDFTINEINTLTLVKNDNVIQFIEMLRTVNNIYLVYQFCNGGNLEELIHERGFIKEEQASEYFGQLLNAFEVLTREKILHRDLKPSNILLHDGVIKIADFGFCKTLQPHMDLTQTMVGSPIYMAPEVLKGEPYSLSADIWSLGVCLFEMLFAKCPFEEQTIPKLMFQIQTKQVEIPHHIQRIGEGTEWLLRRMLTVDPTRRITWQQLFEIQRNGKELAKLQTMQPSPPIKKPQQKVEQKVKQQEQIVVADPIDYQRLKTPELIKKRIPSPGQITIQIKTSDQRHHQNNNKTAKVRSQSPMTVKERGKSPILPWKNQKNQIEISGTKSNVSYKIVQKPLKEYESDTKQQNNYRIQSSTYSPYITYQPEIFQREIPKSAISSASTSKDEYSRYTSQQPSKYSNDSPLLPNKYNNDNTQQTNKYSNDSLQQLNKYSDDSSQQTNKYSNENSLSNKQSNDGSQQNSKYSNDNSQTKLYPNSSIENLRWNLRQLLSKRIKIVDQTKALISIIEINELLKDFMSSITFMVIKYIQQEVELLNSQMNNYQHPESWNILGKWSEFRSTLQFLKCQQIITKDLTKIMQTIEVLKKEIKRQNSIQIMDSVNFVEINGIKQSNLLREGIKHVDMITNKIVKQNDSFTIQQLKHHQKVVLEMLIEIGSRTDPNDLQHNLLIQIKRLYQTSL